jgi:hypothetical protein
MEKIKIKASQKEELKKELFNFYKLVKREGQLFAEFRNLGKSVEDPQKVIQKFLNKNFLIN